MKILIGSLLFTTTIFINFSELYAMWNPNHGHYMQNDVPGSPRQYEAGDMNAVWDPNYSHYMQNNIPEIPHQHGAGGFNNVWEPNYVYQMPNPLPESHYQQGAVLNTTWDPYRLPAMPNFIPNTPRFPHFGGGSSGGSSSGAGGGGGGGHGGSGGDEEEEEEVRRSETGHRLRSEIDMYHLNMRIVAAIRKTRSGEYVTHSCKLDGAYLYGAPRVPDKNYGSTYNYYVKAIFQTYKQIMMKCVIYVQIDKVNESIHVLAVKVPPKPSEPWREDNPKSFDPDAEKWFMSVGGVVLTVLQDPATEVPEGVFLKDNDKGVPELKDLYTGKIYGADCYFAGVHFVLFVNKKKAHGAMLMTEKWPEIKAEMEKRALARQEKMEAEREAALQASKTKSERRRRGGGGGH